MLGSRAVRGRPVVAVAVIIAVAENLKHEAVPARNDSYVLVEETVPVVFLGNSPGKLAAYRDDRLVGKEGTRSFGAISKNLREC